MRAVHSHKRTNKLDRRSAINANITHLDEESTLSLLEQESIANKFYVPKKKQDRNNLSAKQQPKQNQNKDKHRLIRLLQDIVFGMMLGVFVCTILHLLDYCNIINLETKRIVQKTAHTMLNDPEVLESLEEESERKFIPVDIYDATKKEIEDSQVVVAGGGTGTKPGISKGTTFGRRITTSR